MLLTEALEQEGESVAVFCGNIEIMVTRIETGVEIVVFNEAKQIIEELDVYFSEAKDRT